MLHNPKLDEKAIFTAALALESTAARQEYLQSACGADCVLFQHVSGLLALHAEAPSFLETPAAGIQATLAKNPPTKRVVKTIGSYKLRELLGEGGMGSVYVAEQTEPVRRKVALKIIKPGMDSREVVARFAAEQQALALMNHPHIAKVLDAGVTETGSPYFVMELVKGVPVTEYCDRHQLDLRERLDLFVKICSAVQHAHQKGIIHRDLKPSNILVELDDVRPFPKVIDFGVSKAIHQPFSDGTFHTGLTQMIGTPMYMSPEQAQLTKLDVDTRSDIYSLGVLLYELLTGSPPFDRETLKRADFDEMRRIIREVEPSRPSDRVSTLADAALSTISELRKADPRKLSHCLRGELDWIVMKALEKERARRYQTANALADDVQHYINGDSVAACPPSVRYKFSKFARRNKVAIATCLLVVTLCIVGTTVSLWQMHSATVMREEAERQQRSAELSQQAVIQRERELRKVLYALEMKAAWQSWAARDSDTGRQLLEHHRPTGENEDLREFAWHYLHNTMHAETLDLEGHASPVLDVAVSPDDRLIASSDRAGFVFLWEYDTGRKLRDFQYDTKEVTSLSFSPDGRMLATAGQNSRIHLWDTVSWQEIRSFGEHDGTITKIVWSPDGQLLASSGRDQAVCIWDPQNGSCLHQFTNLTDAVRCVAWSPDGHYLAAADGPTVRLWNTLSWQLLKQWRDPTDSLYCLTFSPDSRRLAAVGYGPGIWMYDVQALVPAPVVNTDFNFLSVTFSPDNRFLVTGARHEGPRIWLRNRLSFERVANTTVWGGSMRSVSFAKHGSQLVTAIEQSKHVRVLDFDRLLGYRRRRLNGQLLSLNCEYDRMASVSEDGSIQFSSIQSDQTAGSLMDFSQPITAAAFSAAADLLATACGHELSIWDMKQMVLRQRLPDAPWPIHRLLFSPSGRQLAYGKENGDVRLVDITNGRLVGDFLAHGLLASPHFAFSPDGSLLPTNGEFTLLGKRCLWRKERWIPDHESISSAFRLPIRSSGPCR